MSTTYFTVESMIRGYHVYKDVWESSIGEKLFCELEEKNRHDSNAVAVVKHGMVVGHVPRKISLICALFLRRSGSSIRCEVTGERRHSWDLPQGGLEIPCTLYFEGNSDTCRNSASKAESLIRQVLLGLKKGGERLAETEREKDYPPAKKAKISDERHNASSIWVKLDTIPLSLSNTEKEAIVNGEMLSDLHINFAQSLLRLQFGAENGLHSTFCSSVSFRYVPLAARSVLLAFLTASLAAIMDAEGMKADVGPFG